MYENLLQIIKNIELNPASSDDSTSIHFLNGDSSLNETGTFLYFLLNHVNNIDDVKSLNIDPNIFKNTTIKDFQINETSLKEAWNFLDKKASPSRKIGDIFWSQLPWKSYNDLNVLDIGCGSGGYSKKLFNWSEGKVKSYVGFDLFQSNQWEENSKWGSNNQLKIDFRKVNLDQDNLLELIPEKTNFFMSQSALEHLKYDLRYFTNVKKYINSVDFPVTQVHLFPGAESLRLFLLHGYRQYGLNSIAKILKIFPDSKIELTRLCGNACNDLHYQYITKPIFFDKIGDLRDTRTQEYDELLFKSILDDTKTQIKNPCFWALKIESNS